MFEAVTSVLCVCDDNAAASIMAEATLRAFGAGLQPKSFMQFVAPHGPQLDFVITLSGPSIDMPAPLWKGSPVRQFASRTPAPPRHRGAVHALATWQ